MYHERNIEGTQTEITTTSNLATDGRTSPYTEECFSLQCWLVGRRPSQQNCYPVACEIKPWERQRILFCSVCDYRRSLNKPQHTSRPYLWCVTPPPRSDHRIDKLPDVYCDVDLDGWTPPSGWARPQIARTMRILFRDQDYKSFLARLGATCSTHNLCSEMT